VKIGILIDYMAPGSAPKTISQEVKNLRALGHEAKALIIMHGMSETYQFHYQGVDFRFLFDEFPSWARKCDFRFPGFSFFSLHHLTAAWLVPRLIRVHEFDFVVVHGTYNGFTGEQLWKRCGIPFAPFVWDPASYIMPKVYRDRFLGHFLSILVPMARWLDQRILRHCSCVITSGLLHHKRLREFTDKPLEVVVPGCFPVEKPRSYAERENLMLTFDRWDIGNTPEVFLNMLEKMRSKAKLMVAGHWYPERLKDEFLCAAQARGLLDRIVIEGPLDEKSIQDACSRAKVHLHPNEEAFGMQSLEAAGCGCPIIIPEGSGVAELFEHGKQGFFPPKDGIAQFRGDMGEFARYADLILEDPGIGSRMSQAAWESARRYTWRRHAEQIEALARKYCAGSHAVQSAQGIG
jgi:glycosyltransferase involved in cell wall biosynthesis